MRDRALEIIAVCGADAARWPVTEAATLLALAENDVVVASALADARQLDGLLAYWAVASVSARIDLAAITRLAADIAAGIAFLAPFTPAADPGLENVSTQTALQLATAEGNALGSDADVFASVFTPTVDEDDVI